MIQLQPFPAMYAAVRDEWYLPVVSLHILFPSGSMPTLLNMAKKLNIHRIQQWNITQSFLK